jgi:hypothetical protein
MNIGIIPLVSAVVSVIFALIVLDQYFARRYGLSGYSCMGSALSPSFIPKHMVCI